MIIITGGAGFIGSVLAKKLNDLGHEDIIIVDNLSTSEKWKNLVQKKYINYYHKNEFLDLLSNGSLEIIPKVVFHLGACSSTTETDADYLMQNNFEYSKTLCQWALSHNSQFIYASSAATYGDGELGFDDDVSRLDELIPLNCYGYTKHLFDVWAKKNGYLDKICGFKFFNVYGPNENHKGSMISMVHRGFHQIVETGSIKLFKSYHKDFGDGEQRRDFVYVKDVAQLMIQASKEKVCGIYNIGSGDARSWNDLAKAVFKALNKEAKIEYIEMPEHLKGKYQYYTKAEVIKLQSAFSNLKMTSLEDGIADYINGYLVEEKSL